MIVEVLIGSSVGAAVGFFVLKIIVKKSWDEVKYKIDKYKIYKSLKKDIKQMNYTKFIEDIDKLKSFSAHYNKNKYYSFKKRERINDTIIQDPILFRMKYDPEYLVEINRSKANSINGCSDSSSDQIKLYINERIEETIKLANEENRLDL